MKLLESGDIDRSRKIIDAIAIEETRKTRILGISPTVIATHIAQGLFVCAYDPNQSDISFTLGSVDPLFRSGFRQAAYLEATIAIGDDETGMILRERYSDFQLRNFLRDAEETIEGLKPRL